MSGVIYRVEDNNEKGPYVGVKNFSWNERNHSLGWVHPNPVEEKLIGSMSELIDLDFKCGFSSMVQLYDWFTSKELVALEKLGFNIVKINTKGLEVREGRKQVIFRTKAG